MGFLQANRYQNNGGRQSAERRFGANDRLSRRCGNILRRFTMTVDLHPSESLAPMHPFPHRCVRPLMGCFFFSYGLRAQWLSLTADRERVFKTVFGPYRRRPRPSMKTNYLMGGRSGSTFFEPRIFNRSKLLFKSMFYTLNIFGERHWILGAP